MVLFVTWNSVEKEGATGWLHKSGRPCFCEDKVNGCRVKLCHWPAEDQSYAVARGGGMSEATEGYR